MANVKRIRVLSGTGQNIYVVVLRDVDSFILNDADGTFAVSAADYFVSATEHTTIKGLYTLSESRTAWNDGEYAVLVYATSSASSPSSITDTPLGAQRVQILSDTIVIQSGDSYVGVSAIKGKTDFLPSASAGQAGGVFIAGLNAPTSITNGLSANIIGNVSGTLNSLSPTGISAIFTTVIDGTTTFEQSIRLQNSESAGIVSGAGTSNVLFRSLDNTKTRINASVDGLGNRTSIIRDAT